MEESSTSKTCLCECLISSKSNILEMQENEKHEFMLEMVKYIHGHMQTVAASKYKNILLSQI